MPRHRHRAAVQLPKGVHPVISRGREYFYFQEGRGTGHAGPRIRLPNDPRSPEFWQAIRQAQGLLGTVQVGTVDAALDDYLTWPAFLKLTDGTQDQYKRALRIARTAWGKLPIKGVRPVHVQAIMDGLASTPGNANNFLSAMRAFSTWARVRDHIAQSITEGVKPYSKDKGHRPWTATQIQAAHDQLTGMIRRGVMLYIYTGQRGSDIVRLGWTDVDEGGFGLAQRKTGREVWCPIVPELASEMATWEKRPGPFLLQESGKPFTRTRFSIHFAKVRNQTPILQGVTLHGLRCTAVIRLRRAGLSTGQIGDITGMSLAMIERYCRFADRKTGGQAALLTLKRTSAEQDCKTVQNSKPKA